MTSFQIQNMHHTDEKPFDAGIPICQISGQRFCYYRKKTSMHTLHRSTGNEIQKYTKQCMMVKSPSIDYNKINYGLIHRYTDKPENLKCMASNALLSLIFKNEIKHMTAFVPPTPYLLTTTTPTRRLTYVAVTKKAANSVSHHHHHPPTRRPSTVAVTKQCLV